MVGSLARWIALPVATLAAFILVVFLAGIAADLLHRWSDPIVGFSAALAVVVVAYCCAPAYRLRVAGAAYFIGAVAAYLLLRGAFYPENYVRAYEPTVVPLIATLIGGAVGFGAAWVHHSRTLRAPGV